MTRVLSIEDDPELQHLLALGLTAAGLDVLEKTVQRLREDLGEGAERLRTTDSGYELVG